ncbi:MAG: nucleoside-diphosphate sugar epimerase/dehydratase, partial [Candidatus Omnitrophota bacterium]
MPQKYKKLVTVLMDLILINMSLLLAFMIRFDWQLRPEIMTACLYLMIWASILKITLFNAFDVYRWSFRYGGVAEVINIAKVAAAGTFLLIVVAFLTQRAKIGRSVLLIDYLIFLFSAVIARFLPREIMKFREACRGNLKNVLIVGAGSAAEMVARELLRAPRRVYRPVGFIDDDPAKKNLRIHGIRVLGATDEIKSIVEKYGVEEIIIAIPSASGKVIRDIISKCEKTEAKIKTVPGLHKILSGETTIKQIRDVRPEDLLGRETVRINTEDINTFLKGKNILITGAGGTIGSELCRQIAKFDPRMLILYDHNENDTYFLGLNLKESHPHLEFRTIIGDIKDIGLLKKTFSRYRPDIVFHSAAHKHVPFMEENPSAAVKNNIIGTRNFMYAAEHYGVKSFVMISTDKAVNPTSVMGASKRVAEMVIQSKAKTARTKFMAVRFGNVIGSSGSVLSIFKQQIEKGGPITVTHPDMKRFFMTASEAAQLELQTGANAKRREIYVLDISEQI